jgi:hypothetical protein
MNFKPADFFIGIIDFFGILIPGAVLLLLQGPLFSQIFGLTFDPQGTLSWIVLGVGSYILGHLLLGIGVPLNGLAHIDDWLRKYRDFRHVDGYYQAAKTSLMLPDGIKRTRTNFFYDAYAFVRLSNAAALSEIERQMADYKLFRSLTLVFAIDVVLAQIGVWPSRTPYRWLASLVLFVVSLWRFHFLLNWTYEITFQYYALIRSQRTSTPDTAATGAT